MEYEPMRPKRSHGPGTFEIDDLEYCRQGTIIEDGVLVFHPEHVRLGENVYVGHRAILKGYFLNRLHVGDDSWIGQDAFLHSAGGLRIGRAVGIGPGVRIITSEHADARPERPVLAEDLRLSRVEVQDGCDIGAGAIILPGVTIGESTIVGAGAVVTDDLPGGVVAVGVPARPIRSR